MLEMPQKNCFEVMRGDEMNIMGVINVIVLCR
jgi:hypothetical protein